MAVTLRLTRRGTNRRPFYHLIATDSRAPRDGRRLDTVGIYDPRAKNCLAIKEDRVQHWLSQGAVPSSAVKHLLKRCRLQAQAQTQSESANA